MLQNEFIVRYTFCCSKRIKCQFMEHKYSFICYNYLKKTKFIINLLKCLLEFTFIPIILSG